MDNPNKALTSPGLEAVYDSLARAIEPAGTDKTEQFLVELALLNANLLGHPKRFQQYLQAALQDM